MPRLSAVLLVSGCFACAGLAAPSRPITVWLIPGEEAEARAEADPVKIEEEMRQFNRHLEKGRVRVLNTLPPLDTQLIVWNSAFAVPNWAWVKNQTETIRALQRFADAHDVRINVQFVTWSRAFSDLNRPRRFDGPVPPPDVAQFGSTWAAYFASRRLVVSRPDWRNRRGAWQAVNGLPAAVLPYINDLRLLFYWRRLPLRGLDAPELTLNTSNWESILDSLHRQGGPEDRLGFAGALTLNLIHDYSMLVWAGGGDFISQSHWRTRADLTSDNALHVPRLLARAAAGDGGKRLIAVPESSHQALTQGFVAGDYRATLEPANFVSRWKKDFTKTYGAGKRFWDYAAASVPPQPFHGGSYLAVMPSTDLPPETFELAEFLAIDDEYTKVLARNAHLPSLQPGFGMAVLLDWLGGSGAAEADQFTRLVQQANIQGRSVPDLPGWPFDVEGTDVQEALQRVWRRMGEGNLPELDREAKIAEDVLNSKLDWLTQFKNAILRFWWLGLPIAAAMLVSAWQTHRRTVKALQRETQFSTHIRLLRGFSASALLALGRLHPTIRKYVEVSGSLNEARKRSIIAAGIIGGRRGRDPEGWQPASLETAIWRAILLAFDFEREADLYEKWEEASRQKPVTPREFLESAGRLRKTLEESGNSPSYFFEVKISGHVLVETPFLFEQALTCLVQNAMQAMDRLCDGGARRPIAIEACAERVTVVNEGAPLPAELRSLFNQSASLEEFERRALLAVRTAGMTHPGIGLVEARCVAGQCYAGLHIAEDRPAVSILLRPPSTVT